MYNYGNLSDVEFELLCKDIMSVRLGIDLRTFTRGRDSGIDICDQVINPKVVIQVKHYLRSGFSNLKSSLENEKKNLENIGCKNYYICTSLGLTPDNIKIIYDIFSEYMQDESHILGQSDIEAFLDSEEGNEVLRKHHKLWLISNLMKDMLHRHATIDGEVLIADIEHVQKYFVPTGAYYKCIDQLLKNRILIMTGDPGCGKTITSEMIVMNMMKEGYSVIYLSDHNIKASKAQLSHDSTKKELIFLDDCFGQRYFKIKEGLENELEYLIKYVRMHSNKCLLMNSRVTIFNQAKEMFINLREDVDNEDVKVVVISMNDITVVEKAKILYNHLYFDKVPEEYINEVKLKQKYRDIVQHRNYRPRLIKRFTSKGFIKSVSPQNYVGRMMLLLDESWEIWDDEFLNRIQSVDRIFVNTLYSLTDTQVSVNIHKRAFNSRIVGEGIDTSSSPWENAKNRLIDNMVRIIDIKDDMQISVADPSVNDYLDTYFRDNEAEVTNIAKYATEYVQIERMKSAGVEEKLKDTSILILNFDSECQKTKVVLDGLLEYEIFNHIYDSIVKDFMDNPHRHITNCESNWIIETYLRLLQPRFDEYYKTSYLARSSNSISELLSTIQFGEWVDFFKLINKYDCNSLIHEYESEIREAIDESLIAYISDAEISDYGNDDISCILSSYTNMSQYGPITDYEKASKEYFNIACEELTDDIFEQMASLPQPFNNTDDIKDMVNDLVEFSTDDAQSVLEGYLELEYDEDDYYYERYQEAIMSTNDMMSKVDLVFR